MCNNVKKEDLIDEILDANNRLKNRFKVTAIPDPEVFKKWAMNESENHLKYVLDNIDLIYQKEEQLNERNFRILEKL